MTVYVCPELVNYDSRRSCYFTWSEQITVLMSIYPCREHCVLTSVIIAYDVYCLSCIVHDAVDMQDGDGVMTCWKQQKWWTMILLQQHVDTDELLSNWHHRSSVLSRVNMHWHVERDVVMYQGPFLSIHLSVCLSVCPIMVLNRNNCTYRATFPLHGTNVSLVFESNWPAKTPRISSQLGS